MADKQDGILILHDRCEEQGDNKETYLMEYSLDGRSFKIGSKRKELWGIFTRAERNEPLMLITTSFQKGDDVISYISDVKPVAKIINDRITYDAVNELQHRVLSQQDNERYRSQAISYAKDIEVARIMTSTNYLPEDVTEILYDMYEEAHKIYEFIKGGVDNVDQTEEPYGDTPDIIQDRDQETTEG